AAGSILRRRGRAKVNTLAIIPVSPGAAPGAAVGSISPPTVKPYGRISPCANAVRRYRGVMELVLGFFFLLMLGLLCVGAIVGIVLAISKAGSGGQRGNRARRGGYYAGGTYFAGDSGSGGWSSGDAGSSGSDGG